MPKPSITIHLGATGRTIVVTGPDGFTTDADNAFSIGTQRPCDTLSGNRGSFL